ncbi:beta-fructofuranosidase [Erwinia piriflorinigrans CFBP 5888]|uniref:Sucrose-6-phosphate hydrolase n=2 Tax=Erwinia piriflorinigrans TaxID=665097 RepID=V5Z822_9GAMM|nr:beta-fructofuranosidase [Erwinia piriflorinigrans CFBP 5888]
MMKNTLHRANQAQLELKKKVNDRFYPEFHLAPPAGWMNDPNGLVFSRGIYHAFYQHHPYDQHWGPMHWGHMTSSDMIHWKHQPIALAPGDEYDRDGCFSGCAVEDNGVLTLIYTGHVWLKQPGDDSAIREVQCLATSVDGINFSKQGVILTPPEGIMHFRDPKVWRQDNRWYMVVGARTQDNTGQVLLYSADSLYQWQFERVLASADNRSGYMWECPDFFRLGDKFMLMFSPQGVAAEGYRYRNLFQSGYLLGKWQPESEFVVEEAFQELDGGHDFYAPQSFLAEDGRRIIFAWMDMWESAMPSKKDFWAGCLTLPRELTLDAEGKVRMNPLRELENLREDRHSLAPAILSNQRYEFSLPVVTGELELTLDSKNSHAERYGLELAAGENGNYITRLYVDNQSRRLILDRGQSELGVTGYRSVPLPEEDLLELRIFIDRSSIEVFVNQGESCLTSRIYPPAQGQALRLYAENGSAQIIQCTHWTLGRIADQGEVCNPHG